MPLCTSPCSVSWHAHWRTAIVVMWDALLSLHPLRRGVRLGLLQVGVSAAQRLPRPRSYSSGIATRGEGADGGLERAHAAAPFGAATGLRGVPGPPDDGVSTAWTGAARARTWSLAERSKRSPSGEAGV